ncbi:hypothetical protein [Aquamicrobium defluvii]|uniref:hypothetical protein n=1 Tax=Aquamicrobium defluvii TaxID=69279 RepID=UPI00105F3766|nr:hypothetical protein [Aquamicrobium defluvii]
MSAYKIDQHIGESKELLQALIFIAEQTESEQHELLRHSTVALCWCIIDKLRCALRELPDKS